MNIPIILSAEQHAHLRDVLEALQDYLKRGNGGSAWGDELAFAVADTICELDAVAREPIAAADARASNTIH